MSLTRNYFVFCAIELVVAQETSSDSNESIEFGDGLRTMLRSSSQADSSFVFKGQSLLCDAVATVESQYGTQLETKNGEISVKESELKKLRDSRKALKKNYRRHKRFLTKLAVRLTKCDDTGFKRQGSGQRPRLTSPNTNGTCPIEFTDDEDYSGLFVAKENSNFKPCRCCDDKKGKCWELCDKLIEGDPFKAIGESCQTFCEDIFTSSDQCKPYAPWNRAVKKCACNNNFYPDGNNGCERCPPKAPLGNGATCNCTNEQPFNTETGVCEDCPANSKWDVESASCKCDAANGFVLNAQDNTCICDVDGGLYFLDGEVCTQIPECDAANGFVLNAQDNTCICDPDRFYLLGGRCTEIPDCTANSEWDGASPTCDCNAGYVLNSGVCTAVLDCLPGKEPNQDKTGCVPCGAGTFSRGGSSFCLPCVPGTFSPGGQRFCEICLPGTFSSEPGQAACETCGAGTFSSEFGQAACETCGAGTFSRGGSSFCLTCGAGTFSRGGSPSCLPCDPGTFSPGGQRFCEDCPPGTFSPGGQRFCEPPAQAVWCTIKAPATNEFCRITCGGEPSNLPVECNPNTALTDRSCDQFPVEDCSFAENPSGEWLSISPVVTDAYCRGVCVRLATICPGQVGFCGFAN